MSINRYRLQSMQSAQCHVIIETDEFDMILSTTLVSYGTTVLKIRWYSGSPVMECTGVYSVTTARHINRFTTEFCGENLYHECKKFHYNRNNMPYPFIELSVAQGCHWLECSKRYLNNNFSKPVRRYFGKY